MSSRLSTVLITVVLGCPYLAYAQGDGGGPVSITVSIDGLACASPARNSFAASDFAVAVNTTSGSGGGGAGKTTFTDLTIVKSIDACSLPLFALAARGQLVNRVTVTRGDKRGVDLTIVLENLQIVRAMLSGASDETLDLSYGAITVTDSAGHTTGRIVRTAGSVTALAATHGAAWQM